MKKEVFKIIDPIGIHARPATVIINAISKFNSKIEFRVDNKIANAKSIINIMALGLKKGDEFEVVIEGNDENEAFAELKKVLKKENLVE